MKFKTKLLISVLTLLLLSGVFIQVLGVKAITETSVPIVNATASSYNGITYGPLNAIDGIESASNFWGTSATLGLPQWLTLDLGSVTIVNQVVTHFYDGNPRVYTYYIEASTDGSSWSTVVSTKTGSSVVTDSFSDVSARYVRITVTGNTANAAAHIEEIKVFQGSGTPTPTSSPTPTATPTPTPAATPAPTATPLPSPTAAPQPVQTLFADSFQSGSFSAWKTIGSPTIATSPIHGTDSYSAKFASTGSWQPVYCYQTIGTRPSVFTTLYFQLSSLPSQDSGIDLLDYYSGSNMVMRFGIYNYNGIFIFLLSGSAETDLNLALSVNTWHSLQVQYDGANKVQNVWLDGSNVISSSAAVTSNVDTVKIGVAYDMHMSTNVFVDDVTVASSVLSQPTPTPTSTPLPTSTPVPTPTATPKPTPSPTATPSPTPTPSSTTGNSLPLTGLGGDYLVFYNHDPSEWTNDLRFFTQFNSNTARLSFSFADDGGKASTYSSAKLSAVLSELSSVGVKAIICDFPGDGSQFYGSQAWVNDWKQVASDFRGDSRIKAFELANEPYSYYLAPNANTMSSFNAAISSLIDQIRSIDSSRTIMMPIEFNIFTNDINALYNDFVSHGITSKGNMLYDIIHPYYFQDYPRMDGYNNPTDVADGFWYSLVLPQIQKFGASNCYAGETFCWPRNAGGWDGQINIDYTSQQIFERRMINYFVNAGIGFQMWCFFTSSDQAAQTDALNNSQYYTLIHS